jgi:Protein of unknown function (DUF3108)
MKIMIGRYYMNTVSATLVALAFFCLVNRAGAFPIPERLEFELSYTGITAGHAVQEVMQDGTEIHLVSTARSADWLRFFFPVDDRIESFLTSGSPPLFIGLPRLYQERKHEGKTITNREARFDRQKLEVTTIDHRNKSEKQQAITKRTYDTLSSFFYFRTIPLQVGMSYFIDIYDCNRLWNTEVKVLRREELVTPLGRFKTIVIHPLLKSEGIFARTGDLFIWLTDDDRRIPVQMKSKVVVGSITATLTGGSYWPGRK